MFPLGPQLAVEVRWRQRGGALPDDGHSVCPEDPAARDDRNLLGERLRDEQPVERIPMVERQPLDGCRMRPRERQYAIVGSPVITADCRAPSPG